MTYNHHRGTESSELLAPLCSESTWLVDYLYRYVFSAEIFYHVSGWSIETLDTKKMQLSAWDVGGRCNLVSIFQRKLSLKPVQLNHEYV